MTAPQRVPVLIVGGGGAGLTASMLLSMHGVESLLVSALPTTSTMPKAHVLNQRAMEVFSDVGVADAIYARSTPAAQMSHTAWYVDVCGDEGGGRTLHKMECWDGGYTDPAWVAASPCRQANLPQIRLEPVPRGRAQSNSTREGCCSVTISGPCSRTPRASPQRSAIARAVPNTTSARTTCSAATAAGP